MSHQPCTRCPQDKVCGYEYTVRRGDSFYLIANRLGVPLRDLLEANSDVNPARLMVGDVLCIPMEEDDAPQTPAQPAPTVPETPPVPDESGDLDAPAAPEGSVQDDAMLVCPEANRHVVEPGETAADIQLRRGLNLRTLQDANPSVDLNRLTAGQTLCIPEENIPCGIPETYTLQTEETLESVALRLNTSIASLLRANPCLAPGDFRAGVCIYIPED